MVTTTLIDATDAVFAWLLGERVPAPFGLRLPDGGLESPEILSMLREISAGIRPNLSPNAWLMTADGEAVGLISYKSVPNPKGAVEIGYGVAAHRRGRGHATAAVQAVCAVARLQGIRMLLAATEATNTASQRVLRAAGFATCGSRYDEEDGDLILWRQALE